MYENSCGALYIYVNTYLTYIPGVKVIKHSYYFLRVLPLKVCYSFSPLFVIEEFYEFGTEVPDSGL